MVEFKLKTIVDQDCTLDAANADLYDGSSEYLKAGGSIEPKKALFRFNVAEKPNYGDAELSYAELGIYTTGVTKGQTTKIPQFNIYKMKSSANGEDWGASGRIRTVQRGKRIIKRDGTANSIEVQNHGLFTGDVVTYSPFVNFYGDVSLGANIENEVEYYAIRSTRDELFLASTLERAIKGQSDSSLRVSLTESSGVTETVGGDVPNFPSADSNYGITHYGWLRSEKYSSDIHIVTSWYDNAETLSEDFNGSEYRESNMDFQYSQRSVIRRGDPYLEPGNLENELWDTKSDTLYQNGDEHDLICWYGWKDKTAVPLQSHKTNADGSGWWRTKKTARWSGKDDYVPKNLPIGSKTKNPAVKYDDEILTGAEPYGDEVTPANCFFHRVKGAAEFQEAAEDDSGTNELQATGAIRFSTKKVKTGGQSMNVYQFWKKNAIGVDYTSPSGLISGRQECMVLRKDIPWAPYQGLNWDLSGLRDHIPDQAPPALGAASSYSPQTPSMNISMNIEKLEKAYTKGVSATTDNIYVSRGITFIFAEIPPLNSETLFEYLKRLGDDNGTVADGDTFGHASGKNCLGWSVINTDMGLRIFGLHDAVFDNTNTDLYWPSVSNHALSTFIDGSNKSSVPSAAGAAQDPTDARTGMSEGEWYDFRLFHENNAPNQDPATVTTGSQQESHAHLHVENSEGEAVHYLTTETFDERAIMLYNCKDSTNPDAETGNPLSERNSTDGTNWPTKATWWGKNMSIWFSNRKSDWVSGTGKGQDWMGGWDKENSTSEDRDTESNIFIDSLSYKNINQSHANSTLGQVGSGASRDRISISSGRKYDKMVRGNMSDSNDKGSSRGNREGQSDTTILIGVEDPSQISSHCQFKKSWRYLYFQDYQCANLSADAPLIWTADGTLPHNKGNGTSPYLEAGTTGTQQWWSNTKVRVWPTTGSPASKRYWDDYDNQNLDYGMPMTYNNWINDATDVSYQLAPSITTSYTSAADSIGMQWGTANIEQRELHMNRTGGWSNKDTDQTFEAYNLDSVAQGGIGANLRMHQTAPALGMVCSPEEGSAISSNTIRVESTNGGPTNDGSASGHNFLTGAKVVYAKFTGDDITGLTSSKGDFTDNPADGAGTYYIIRVGTTCVDKHYTDESTQFKLAASYDEAITGAGSPITISAGSATGSHVFYDYEYYMNRYYYTNGFSQKGFNRLILQPTIDASDIYINAEFMAADGTEDDAHLHAEEEKYYLCKREHISCSAKILEIADESVMSPSSTHTPHNSSQNIQLRVDTTTPLRSTEGTRYRVFVPVTAASADNYASNLTIQILDEENIVIEGWKGYSDTGTTKLLKKDHLSELWISPEKYWIYYNIRPETGDTETGAKGIPNKSYGNIAICAPSGSGTGGLTGLAIDDSNDTVFADADYEAWGTSGATYNESTANFDRVGGVNGAYINAWTPELNLSKNKTIFDLSDFGYGGAKEDKDNIGGENGVLGGNVSTFIPRANQINYIKMPKIFTGVEQQKEGDTLDIAVAAESSKTDGIIGIASVDNSYLPKPFLLTVFKDEKPANPTDFKVKPYEKDAFLPEFSWSSSDSDLWYGFIIIDDRPINSQYHHSLLHVPLNEDLRSVASDYDSTKGWKYDDSTSPVVYGYRYENTTVTPTGVHAGSALSSSGTTKVNALDVELYDNVEGLAGNTKYFEEGFAEFNWDETSTDSDFSYPVDEMSVVVHVTPDSWGDNRWICSFNEPADTSTTKDSWGIYLDANGQVNVYVGAAAGNTHPTTHIELKSTSKLPVDGTPTCIIVTVDTQLYSGNVKLYINGKLEDLSGLRGTLSTNNWPTDTDGVGGENIFYDTDGTENLFIGAKSKGSGSEGYNDFLGRIEEFVWYDKCIYPVTPQNGKMVLEKPLEELIPNSSSSSSKSYIARLFIKDYHNIRGKTTGEVAASSQVSFKKAAFELYT